MILARWLATNPQVLILDEPTRGIDVGAKAEIQKLVLSLAEEGKACVFISSELEEVMRTSHRIAVVLRGPEEGDRVQRREWTRQVIMQSMAGGEMHETARPAPLVEEERPRAGSSSRSSPLALILLFDSVVVPGFFRSRLKDGNLYGSLIDILRNGSTVMLLAIGMTLVIATGGVDLSVGAVMAIAASVAALLMNPYVLAKELPPNLMRLINDPNFTFQPLWVVILVTLLVAIVCGLWNGCWWPTCASSPWWPP